MFPKRLKQMLIIILLIIIAGTIGFKLTGSEKTTILDALFMTAITISTVGYGDYAGIDTSPAGKIFTIIFIFLGAGVIAYLFTTLAAYIVEGELKEVFRRRRMEKRIERLRDHYIVCGIGMVGLYIVNELYQTRRPLVAIDLHENKLDILQMHNINVDLIVGDSTENEILEKANIAKAKGLFATTNSDNDNIVIVLTAKQMNPSLRVVSRCNDTKNLEKLKMAGAEAVVALNYIGGLRMASEMVRPNVTNFLDKMLRDKESHLRVDEVQIPKESPFVGKKVSDIDFRSMGNALLVALRNSDGKWIYNPPPDTILEKDMNMILLATVEEREILERLVSPFEKEV
ncbi:MAG TPA: NAD-binding protein [Syntrophorhabdaceae bacterium]|nr:NAD-binding protein [Syntrophorhabdaceae bacterium]